MNTPAKAKIKLLKKAEDMLWKRGYDGTSVNDLVRAAGVSKGAFFHHFPSKQALISHIIDSYARQELLKPLQYHLSRARTPKHALLNWIQERYRNYESTDFKRGCLLGNFALELSDKDEEVREQLKQVFLEWENLITSALKPLAAEGKIDLEPRQIARMIIAQWQGATMMAKVHKDKNRAGREFMALGQMIERMIRD